MDELAASWTNTEHSVFGPSSAARYLRCLGSVIPNIQAEDEAGYAAAEGTVAHHVADVWLREGKHVAEELVGTVMESDGHRINIDELMLNELQPYVDWCLAVPGDHYFETKIDISPLTPIPNQFGTADHYALDFGHMTITDLKYGEGVKVFAAETLTDPRGIIDGELNGNPQAMLYAAGVFLEWDWFYGFETLTIRICQPRLDHYDVWETTREHLLGFMAYAKERMAMAWRPGQPRSPSVKACRWCRVERTCPAVLAWTEQNISGRFQDLEATDTASYTSEQMEHALELLDDPTQLALEPVPVSQMTVRQMANVLRYRPLVEGWFKKVSETIKDLLLDGQDVPLWKIVEGRANRKFIDEEAAASALLALGVEEDELFSRRMISPNAAEDQLRVIYKESKADSAGRLVDLVLKPTGPPTLAPLVDSRDALEADGDRFQDLGEQ